MTYIVGATFTVGKKIIKPGFTSSQSNKVTSSTTILPHGTYTINNIKKNVDNVIYTFVNENFEQVEVEFDSISQAERYISAMKNEVIPDYTEIYKKLT